MKDCFQPLIEKAKPPYTKQDGSFKVSLPTGKKGK